MAEALFSALDEPYSSSPEIGVRVTAENPIATRGAIALGNYLQSTEGREIKTPLPHQKDILADIWRGLNDGYHRGYVESPTASGKTYVMCRLADACYAAGLRVLMLADRRQQADQILGKVGNSGLLQVSEHIDFRHIGAHYESSQAKPEDRVVVSTYSSFNKFAPSGKIGDFDVMICDEAHRTLGPVTSSNLISFSPMAIKAGFTATSAYSLDKKVDEIFEYPYHASTIKEAVEADIIAPLTCLIYTTNAEIPHLDSDAEFTQEELEFLISLKGRNQKAIEFARGFVADDRQGIIACVPGSNLAHARMLAQELDGDIVKLPGGGLKTIRARAIGSFLSPGERREALQQFENGQIDVLTFVDMITEGWNSEVASFLIDLQPTVSIVKKTQKIGRVLRKKANDRESIVVDFMDITRKFQITALDALQESRYVLGQSFRSKSRDPSGQNGHRTATNRDYIERILNSDLWLELRQIDMQRIADLRLRNASKARLSIKDPLVEEYEQQLGRYYGGEPFNSTNIPLSVISGLNAYMKRYVRQQRALPEVVDLEAFIVEKIPGQAKNAQVLAQLALTGFDAEPRGLLEADKRVPADYDLVEDDVLFNERMETLDRVLQSLPPRDRRVLELRYGLDGDKAMTLEQIGQHPEVQLTGNRVRQIEGGALAKLATLREVQQFVPESGYVMADMFGRRQIAEKRNKLLARQLELSLSSAENKASSEQEIDYELALLAFAAETYKEFDGRWPQAYDTKILRDVVFRVAPHLEIPERTELVRTLADLDWSLADRERAASKKMSYEQWLEAKVKEAVGSVQTEAELVEQPETKDIDPEIIAGVSSLETETGAQEPAESMSEPEQRKRFRFW